MMNENFGGMNNGTVEKKEFKKKKLFESYDDSMNIDYVAEQAKLTKSLTRIKIGIVLGIVSLLFWIINAEVDVSLDQITENVALWSGLVAYIIGGSIRWVFKFVKFCANVAYLIAPGFFTGVASGMTTCLLALVVAFTIPLICIVLNYIETRKKLAFVNKKLVA